MRYREDFCNFSVTATAWSPTRILALIFVAAIAACAPSSDETSSGSASEPTAAEEAPLGERPEIIANNAFFYYAELDKAWTFYTETLGLETVADYGFAKILRVAGSSYLTLVDVESGMHTLEEPKTVAIALVTEDLERWYDYLKQTPVEFRSELKVTDGSAHDGFVVYDPEGYFLEFERFNPHPENASLMPRLERANHVVSGHSGSQVPEGLGFKATVLWMYYRDMAAVQAFYEKTMGFELVVDQGWAKVYPTSATGYIGLVDETRGMHSFTQDKAVTASFLTEDIRGWFDYLKTQPDFVLRTEELLTEADKVLVFVGYDPENYFLEFDTFLDKQGNERLIELLEPSNRLE